MQSNTTRPKKAASIILFLIVLLFWFATITHDTLGFVPPVNGEAIGFDLFTALVWGVFLYCGLHLYHAFRGSSQAPVVIKADSQGPEIRPAPFVPTWTGNITGNRTGLELPPKILVGSSTPTIVESQEITLVGVGGWLRLLTVKLALSAVIRLLGGLDGFSNGTYLVAAFNLGSALLTGIAAYLLETKNPKGVLLTKIYLILDAVYYLAVLVIGPSSTDFADRFKPVGFLLTSVLYFVYLLRSRRVRNTYKPTSTLPASQAASA